jgi:hypothetical protein
MESGISISLILGFASIVISICFGLMPTLKKRRIEILEEKEQRLLWNIKLFLK